MPTSLSNSSFIVSPSGSLLALTTTLATGCHFSFTEIDAFVYCFQSPIEWDSGARNLTLILSLPFFLRCCIHQDNTNLTCSGITVTYIYGLKALDPGLSMDIVRFSPPTPSSCIWWSSWQYLSDHSWCCIFCALDKCIITCIHYYCIIQSIFTVQKFPCTLPIHPSPQPILWKPLSFLLSLGLPYPEHYIFGII